MARTSPSHSSRYRIRFQRDRIEHCKHALRRKASGRSIKTAHAPARNQTLVLNYDYEHEHEYECTQTPRGSPTSLAPGYSPEANFFETPPAGARLLSADPPRVPAVQDWDPEKHILTTR